MKVIKKKLTKVLYPPKSNSGVRMQVIISSDGLDSAEKIFKESGLEYVGVPVYMPIADAYISDEVEVVTTDTTKAEAEKVKDKPKKKGKEK